MVDRFRGLYQMKKKKTSGNFGLPDVFRRGKTLAIIKSAKPF